jgi:exosortase N
MIQAVPVSFKKLTSIQMAALVLYLAYAVIMLISLHAYIAWQSVNVVLGLIALPLVTVIQPGNTSNTRYGITAVCFAILTVLLPVKTMLYFTIAFAFLFITENFSGKINWLPVWVICFMSPVFQFATNVFSFPIRLQLTNWAGYIMNRVLGHVIVKGNMIVYNGNEFSVDPACMGLNMMVTSLLLQLIIIAMYQRKYDLQLRWHQTAGLLAMTFILNVISNLFRIVCLVWLNILPGTYMHELVGILCLLLYVIIPVVWFTKWLIRNKGCAVVSGPDNKAAIFGTKALQIHIGLLLIVCWACYSVINNERTVTDSSAAIAPIDGYRTERVNAEIIKLQNSQSLVYIKYIPGFYNADHHPMICWAGSGYLFRQVQQETIGKQRVYTALLQNGKESLYTSWWYDNGLNRTIDQLSWRSQMLSGAKPYSVINITAANKQQLVKEIEDVLRYNKLKPLL